MVCSMDLYLPNLKKQPQYNTYYVQLQYNQYLTCRVFHHRRLQGPPHTGQPCPLQGHCILEVFDKVYRTRDGNPIRHWTRFRDDAGSQTWPEPGIFPPSRVNASAQGFFVLRHKCAPKEVLMCAWSWAWSVSCRRITSCRRNDGTISPPEGGRGGGRNDHVREWMQTENWEKTE